MAAQCELPAENLRQYLSTFMEEWAMMWKLYDAKAPMKTIIFCSKEVCDP